MGDLLLDTVKLPVVPAPGQRVAFAGDEYDVADVPPTRRVERLDVGLRELKTEVVTMTATKRAPKASVPVAAKQAAPSPSAARRIWTEIIETPEHHYVVRQLVGGPWAVMRDDRRDPVADPEAAELAPNLVRLASTLNARDVRAHPDVGVRSAARRPTGVPRFEVCRTCPLPIERVPFFVAPVPFGAAGCLCRTCATERAPALVSAVDEWLNTFVMPSPPAPSQPRIGREELAERDRVHRADQAIVKAARALFNVAPGVSVTVPQADKARQLLEAAAEWISARPQ